jgi:hypothetical protein
MSFKRMSVLHVLVIMLFFSFGSAQAIVIGYEATDLENGDDGQDLWRYTYWVSDHQFAANTGFTIHFGLEYGAIIAHEAHSDWDILLFEPDPAGGRAFDALTLEDSPSLTPFIVDFIWLGTGTPGDQWFEIYCDGEFFKSLGSGWTQALQIAPVPEPATWLLLCTGCAGLSYLKRKRSNNLTSKK